LMSQTFLELSASMSSIPTAFGFNCYKAPPPLADAPDSIGARLRATGARAWYWLLECPLCRWHPEKS